MSNDLVVIEKENALTVLSDKDGVEKLIEDVRDRVMSLEGGNLNTVSGRKAIRSNAFKATKAKTAINDEYIQPLISKITEKIQPDLDAIQALKDNKKILNAGLDKIRKDVNAEVQEIEDEIARVEAEKKAAIEAKELKERVDADHEMALLLNEKFDREAEEARKYAEEAERIRLEKEAKEKAEHDRLISEQARLQAEKEAKDREERLIREAKEAQEQAERNRLAAIEREKYLEKQKVEAEIKAKRDAEEAAELARQAEIKRYQEEEKRKQEQQAKLEANQAHADKIHNEMVSAICSSMDISEDLAKDVVRAIASKKVPHVIINY